MSTVATALLVLLVVPALAGAQATCLDPVPDPEASGWTHEGGGTFTTGARLLVVDPGFGATIFKTFRCSDPAMFQADIVLTPSVAVDSTFIPEPDGNLGIHVTINDGANQFRAVLFREGVSSVRVRIALPGEVFSPGFAFPGLGADFSISRLTNGSMVLSVANPIIGGPPLQEIFNPGDVPQTNVENVEFGTYGYVASSLTSDWETLGLPRSPIIGTSPVLVPVDINLSAGHQNDPHVSGDWVAYTSDLSIHYYSFATQIDAGIPMEDSARDLLSDVSGSRIVFSRVISGVKTAVMVFDTATAASPVEIDAALGTTRLGSAIGGDTVAYIDFGLEANGELVIHDLSTSTSLRITNDTVPDQSPSVSPDGTVVTWEHCNSSFSNCNIWKAVKDGAVWSVSIVSNTPNSESNPDTNGAFVVYDSFRSGNADVFWRLPGGHEVHLQTSSFEGNPSIAGHFISFESRPTLAAATDIFVYDMTSNLLYQITDTPLVIEQLNDMTMLPNGDLRVVWASNEDGNHSRNIKGATFRLSAPVPTLALQVPATITVNATSPSGAIATYVVTATDAVDPNPAVACVPSSGSSFPIGTTGVSCTATNAFSDQVTGGFSVVVKGAPDQISALIALVHSFDLRPAIALTLEAELWIARALATSTRPGDRLRACGWLNLFIREVQALTGRAITPLRAAQLIAQANQIKAVLGCG
jgi:hypothetical protein